MNRLREYILQLPKLEEVKKWKSLMDSEIEEFRRQGFDFCDQFKVQNEIIRRYDEVINTKASKMSLKTVFKDIDDMVEGKLKKSEAQFEHL